MFGKNEIVGKKFFKDAPKDSLFVTSMFFTIQGEGPYAGLPALFIRLAKCNLSCTWCDTYFDGGDWMTFDQIRTKSYEVINDYWNNRGLSTPLWMMSGKFGVFNCILVVTGGEPLLQENLTEFLKRNVNNFDALQIESNGTINTEVPLGVTLVCSPKCSEKNGVAAKYLKPSKVILERADCLKFVITSDTNSPYNQVPQWALDWKRETGNPIYVSPMNIYNDVPQKIKIVRANEQNEISMDVRSTVDETVSFWEPGLLNMEMNQKNHEYAAQYAMDNGLRLNLQMHLYAGIA